MPRRGRSNAKVLQREPSIIFGELDTTPTSHHAESLGEQASPQNFFEDVIADEDLLALDDLQAPDPADRKARSFTWSEAGSTRRSSPLRGETPNHVWEFDVDDLLPAMSSPKSGIDKLPATLPLPPQDHLEPKDIQPAEKPAHKVDFSETASTVRRSTPFGLEEISSQGPWEFETPSVKQTSLAITDHEGLNLSKPPENGLNKSVPPKMLSDVAVGSNVARPSKHEISVHSSKSSNIHSTVVEPLLKLPVEPAPVSNKLQQDALDRTGFEVESEEELLYPSSPQISRLGAHPYPLAESSEDANRKSRKRKQRAKSPVKFDENTQQVRGQKRAKQERISRMPLVTALKNSVNPPGTPLAMAGAQKGKRKRAAPLASTKAPAKKKPRAVSRNKRKAPISRTTVTKPDPACEKAAEKPDDSLVTVEKLISPPRLHEPCLPTINVDENVIILSSDAGSSEFLPSSPTSILPSSGKKILPSPKGRKKRLPILKASKSNLNCPRPQQKTEAKPSSEKDMIPDISNGNIQSPTPPSLNANDLIDKIDEAKSGKNSTSLAPKENKCGLSRYDLENDSIPEPAENQRKEQLVEGSRSGIGGTERGDMIIRGNKESENPFGKNSSDKREDDERTRESSQSKLILMSNLPKDHVTDSISSAEQTQHNSTRRPRADLNPIQSRTLSISEAGSPVRLDSQAGGSNGPRYRRANELQFKDLDPKDGFSRIRPTAGNSTTDKSQDKTRRIQDLISSFSKVENNLKTAHTVKSHAPKRDDRLSSGESASSRLRQIRGKIRTQMKVDLEEQAAIRNRLVAQHHNRSVSNSFGDLSTTKEATLPPSPTRGIRQQLHGIAELVSDQLSKGEKRIQKLPGRYMTGILSTLHKIERRFDRERSTVKEDWARDGELFRRRVLTAQNKVTTVQDERSELLGALEEQQAQRRLLYSRASTNLLALNRTLLNSTAALKDEPS